MHPITFDKNIAIDGYEFEINNPANCEGSYVRILDKIYSQLIAMLSHHCKVLVCMQIYHLHDYSEDNKVFSDFVQKYKKRLKKRFGFTRIGYVWVREQGQSEPQHYHLALFLDGNKVQCHHGIFKLAEKIWTDWGHPHPSFVPQNSYYNLNREDGRILNHVLYHLSYMAKVRTKDEKRSLTVNRYEGSRIDQILRN